MDTSSITREYRKYIPLLLEVIMESPVKRDGRLIPYEEVVAELEADTIGTATQIGFLSGMRFSCGAYGHTVNLMLQVSCCVSLCSDLLFSHSIENNCNH